jgi:SAM-dependent methyltransferase
MSKEEFHPRDISPIFNRPYSESAPIILGDQHEFLLQTLEKYLETEQAPSLLVLGSGGQVLPYSRLYTEDGQLGESNRDRIKSIIGDGSIILLDYLLKEEVAGLEMGRQALEGLGFFSPEFFRLGQFNPQSITCSEVQIPASISFLLNNLRDTLKVEDEAITAADANLSIHHASVTRQELARVYQEIFRVLKPGGLLHLGEGNVDMNHTEDKIIQIGQDLASIMGMSVLITDQREAAAGYVMYSFFAPGEKYPDLPVIPANELKSKKGFLPVRITEDGLVIIRANNPGQTFHRLKTPDKLARILKEAGYINMFVSFDSISLPLVDHKMPGDQRHIEEVNRYYAAISARSKPLENINHQLFTDINKGVEFEKGNAERGVAEYYMGEKQILKTLNEVGFQVEQVRHYPIEPFYNIVATKPSLRYPKAGWQR